MFENIERKFNLYHLQERHPQFFNYRMINSERSFSAKEIPCVANNLRNWLQSALYQLISFGLGLVQPEVSFSEYAFSAERFLDFCFNADIFSPVAVTFNAEQIIQFESPLLPYCVRILEVCILTFGYNLLFEIVTAQFRAMKFSFRTLIVSQRNS